MKFLLSFLLLLTLGIVSTFAQTTRTWTGSSSSNWATAGNWSPSGVPAANDPIVLNSVSRMPILTANQSVASFKITGGVFDLGTYTLTITSGTADFQGGTINNGLVKPNGNSLSKFWGTTFGALVEANSVDIQLNGSIFQALAKFDKTGNTDNGKSQGTGGNTFQQDVHFINSGVGSGAKFWLHRQNDDVFQGNVYVNITQSSGGYIYFGSDQSSQLGKGILANSKQILVGSGGLNAGRLHLYYVEQQGNTAQNLSLGGTAHLYVGLSGKASVFNANVVFSAPNIFLRSSTFKGTVEVIKTTASAVIDASNGGNTFEQGVIYRNTGDGALYLNIGAVDTYLGDIQVFNTGLGSIRFGRSDATGKAVLTAGKRLLIPSGVYNSGELHIDNFEQYGDSSQNWTLGGTATIYMGKLGNRLDSTDNRPVFFQAPVRITAPNIFFRGARFEQKAEFIKSGNSSSTYTEMGGAVFEDLVYFRNEGTASLSLYNRYDVKFAGDVQISNTGNGTINLGHASAKAHKGKGILLPNRQLLMDASTFTGGILNIYRFEQLGNTPQSFSLGGGSEIFLGLGKDSLASGEANTVRFEGNTQIIAPKIRLKASSFLQGSNLVQTGTGTYSPPALGGNLFQGETTLSNTGTGVFYLGTAFPDTFAGNVTFSETNTGTLKVASQGENLFQGNLSISGNGVVFGADGGEVKLTGNKTQVIKHLENLTQIIPKIEIAQSKSSRISSLASPIQVNSSLELSKGNLRSDSTGLLILDSGISNPIGSDSSYVTGKVRKIGNTNFTFPSGVDGKYRPITVSGISINLQVTLGVYDTQQTLSNQVSTPDLTINGCEYFTLESNQAVNLMVSMPLDQTCVDYQNPLPVRLVNGQWTPQSGSSYNASTRTLTYPINLPINTPQLIGSGTTQKMLTLDLSDLPSNLSFTFSGQNVQGLPSGSQLAGKVFNLYPVLNCGANCLAISGIIRLNFPVSSLERAHSYEFNITAPNSNHGWLDVSTFGISYTLNGQTTFLDNERYTLSKDIYQGSKLTLKRGTYTGDLNYVRTYTAQVKFNNQLGGALAENLLIDANTPKEQVMVATQYLDGLGRPIQTVAKQASPQGEDIVQLIDYDAFGRSPLQYAPFVGGTDGLFKANDLTLQKTYYNASYDPNVPSAPMPDFWDATKNRIQTDVAYAETVFEASPLNRVVEQGSIGQAWQIAKDGQGNSTSLGKTIKSNQRPNSQIGDKVRIWQVQAGNTLGFENLHFANSPYYGDGELWVSEVVDEHQVKTLEYKNKQGQVILKRSQSGMQDIWYIENWGGDNGSNPNPDPITYISTYYIYDDLGHLRYVLQPEAVKLIENKLADNQTWTWAEVQELCFAYQYDGRGRMVMKKVPGTARNSPDKTPFEGEMWLVYDVLDRLVASQDGRQRLANQWTFTKYDGFNRPIMMGLFGYVPNHTLPSTAREQLQNNINDFYAQDNNQDGVFDNPLFENKNNVQNQHYYSNQAFPVLNLSPNQDLIHSITYYDTYDFNENGTNDRTFDDSDSQFTQVWQASALSKGKITASKVRVLKDPASGEQWLNTVSFYDERARVIQIQADNHRQINSVGFDVSTHTYDFAGRLLQNYLHHPNITTQTSPECQIVVNTNGYDHNGRLLWTKQGLNNPVAGKLIAEMTYNDLGQLIQKKLGDNLQKINYRYNVRGWLSHINEADLNNAGHLSQDKNDLFGMELLYEQSPLIDSDLNNPLIPNHHRQFNGNISAVRWKTGSDLDREYHFTYDYDNLNRLNHALLNNGVNSYGDIFDNSVEYDDNGNITQMQRGVGQASTDIMSYTYQNNRLIAVENWQPNPQITPIYPQFEEKNHFDSEHPEDASAEYTYDFNGSLVGDLNKGIVGIQYNHLNLPSKIIFEGNKYIQYLYDAAGIKLQKMSYDPNADSDNHYHTTDYIGGMVYENDVLQFVHHSEGRVLAPNTLQEVNPDFVYEYQYKDHLGNLRVSFREGATEHAYTASMEELDLTIRKREESQFMNIQKTRDNRLGRGTNNFKTTKIDPNQPMGPWKSLQISKGDKINIDVYAYYEANTQENSPHNGGLSVFLGLNPTYSNTTNESGQTVHPSFSLSTLQAGIAFSPSNQNPQPTIPNAYVRYIVYDLNKNYLYEQIQYISSAAKFNVNWEHLQMPEFEAFESGYIEIFVANESEVAVWFDDLNINHQQSLIAQENHYDPWGLNLTGIEKQGQPNNKFQFMGVEKNVEFDLNWTETAFRTYDTQLGRFHQVDMMADKYVSITGYNYSFNNPILLNDPSGLDPRYDWDNKNYYEDANGNGKRDKGEEDRSWNDVQNHINNTDENKTTNFFVMGTSKENDGDREASTLMGITQNALANKGKSSTRIQVLTVQNRKELLTNLSKYFNNNPSYRIGYLYAIGHGTYSAGNGGFYIGNEYIYLNNIESYKWTFNKIGSYMDENSYFVSMACHTAGGEDYLNRETKLKILASYLGANVLASRSWGRPTDGIINGGDGTHRLSWMETPSGFRLAMTNAIAWQGEWLLTNSNGKQRYIKSPTMNIDGTLSFGWFGY